MSKIRPSAYGCPMEAASDVIGGKWKSRIIFHLLTRTIRFNELRRLLPKVTQRMLTLQLRELEHDGVVHREIYREVPPRVEYSLTPLGLSLKDIILPMRDWGTQLCQSTQAGRDRGCNAVALDTGEAGPADRPENLYMYEI